MGMDTVATDDLPKDNVPDRVDVLVDLDVVTVMLVDPLDPDEGVIFIQEGMLVVSQLKLDVMMIFLDSPSATKLKEDTLADIPSLIEAAP